MSQETPENQAISAPIRITTLGREDSKNEHSSELFVRRIWCRVAVGSG
jgi:hypothetical protein